MKIITNYSSKESLRKLKIERPALIWKRTLQGELKTISICYEEAKKTAGDQVG